MYKINVIMKSGMIHSLFSDRSYDFEVIEPDITMLIFHGYLDEEKTGELSVGAMMGEISSIECGEVSSIA